MKTIKQVALSLYDPPFIFKRGYIWDANNQMVADQEIYQEEAIKSIMRIRGWGRIQYLKKFKPEDLQDEVGKLCAQALTEFWRTK